MILVSQRGRLISYAKRYLPKPIKIFIKSVFSIEYIGNTTHPKNIGSKGAFVSNYWEKLRDIPGFFNFDDAFHFSFILNLQSLYEIEGDMLEVGSFHGRSAALMSVCLKPSERLHVCDSFGEETEDQRRYYNKPTPQDLLKNIMSINNKILRSQIVIHNCLSDNIKLDENIKFRFIHLDGGHSAEQIRRDLAMAKKHILPKGIISIDDYGHPGLPEVQQGVDQFLNDNQDMRILMDANRHGADGRKLYIYK